MFANFGDLVAHAHPGERQRWIFPGNDKGVNEGWLVFDEKGNGLVDSRLVNMMVIVQHEIQLNGCVVELVNQQCIQVVWRDELRKSQILLS